MSDPRTAGHDGPRIASRSPYDIVDCRQCSFVHVVPLPSPSEVIALYAEDFYANEKPDYIDKTDQEREYWSLVHHERLAMLEAFADGPGRILDVGSSAGWFLETAGSRGWSILGLEPSNQAAAVARQRGVPVEQCFLHDLGPHHSAVTKLGTFNAVHASLVVEHLPDPAGFFRTVHHLLVPGGVLCVEVPNDFNPLQRVLRCALGKDQYWLAPPHHLNYFTPETLEQLFCRTGYKIEVRTTTFPMELFVLLGFDYIGDDAIGRACHGRRMMFERHLAAAGLGDLKRQLYEAIAKLGIGREAVVVGRRP